MQVSKFSDGRNSRQSLLNTVIYKNDQVEEGTYWVTITAFEYSEFTLSILAQQNNHKDVVDTSAVPLPLIPNKTIKYQLYENITKAHFVFISS